MHGGDNQVTNLAGSIAVYEVAASTDKTLAISPGLRHEILDEPEVPEVIAATVAWLNARAK